MQRTTAGTNLDKRNPPKMIDAIERGRASAVHFKTNKRRIVPNSKIKIINAAPHDNFFVHFYWCVNQIWNRFVEQKAIEQFPNVLETLNNCLKTCYYTNVQPGRANKRLFLPALQERQLRTKGPVAKRYRGDNGRTASSISLCSLLKADALR